MSAFVVVNLLIAVICDALQILRTAEAAVVQKMHGSYVEEDEGFEMDANGMILEGSGGEQQQSDGGAAAEEALSRERMSRERIQLRVRQMEHMLDEMVVSQQTMARTIDYLSLALSADRKPYSLNSINEINLGIGVSESSREGMSLEPQLGVGQ